jgi:hypothetical protein
MQFTPTTSEPGTVSAPLMNSRQIAARLGVSPFVLKGIKRAGKGFGDTPFTGRYSTLPRIHEWLKRHPEFVASHYLRTGAR